MTEHTLKTLKNVVPIKDVYGEPIYIAGGNSAVFRAFIDQKDVAIKCFYDPQQNMEQRIDYFTKNGDDIIECDVSYFPEELWIWDDERLGRWCDVVVKSWKDGYTLRFEVRKALNNNDTERLSKIAQMFDSLALRLLKKEWAHGDIKPENIIINKNNITLIDHGSCYIPSYNFTSNELGTPQYQHPRRNAAYFNKHIDDYPIALISATLHTIAYDPTICSAFCDSDILLFDPIAIANGNYKAIEATKKIASKNRDEQLHKLIETLLSPTPKIEGLVEILQSQRKLCTKQE